MTADGRERLSTPSKVLLSLSLHSNGREWKNIDQGALIDPIHLQRVDSASVLGTLGKAPAEPGTVPSSISLNSGLEVDPESNPRPVFFNTYVIPTKLNQ